MIFDDPIKDIDWIIGALDSRRRKALGIAQEYGELHDDLTVIRAMYQEDPVSMGPIFSSGSTPVAIGRVRDELESSPSPESWAPSLQDLRLTVQLMTTSTATAYMTTTTLRQPEDRHSAMYQPSNPAYVRLRDRIRQRDRRPDVERLLDGIDSTVADIYRTAWQTWPLPTSDPSRGPLFLMREVLTHILITLSDPAPDPEKKTRRRRVEWMTNNLAKTSGQKELLERATQDVLDAYDNLCRAHSLGRLEKGEAELWMWQADDYLALLLEAIDLGNWEVLKPQVRKP